VVAFKLVHEAVVGKTEKPIANPYVVLREEFDDWAILFNPDTGHGFGLSPTAVYVWKLLDGKHTTDDLLEEIHSCADGVPDEVLEHLGAFIEELTAEGLVGFGSTGSDLAVDMKGSESPFPRSSGRISEMKTFKYEPPKLIDLGGAGRQLALGANCMPGSSVSGICMAGDATSYCYATGASPGHPNCLNGSQNIGECNTGNLAHGYCDTGTSR
jgi:SynChlorMet cassette protein ScmD